MPAREHIGAGATRHVLLLQVCCALFAGCGESQLVGGPADQGSGARDGGGDLLPATGDGSPRDAIAPNDLSAADQPALDATPPPADSAPPAPVQPYGGCTSGGPEAQFLGEQAPAAKLDAGQTVSVWLRFANCSGETWTKAAASAQSGHKLGCLNDNGSWGPKRIALPADVPPKHQVTISFQVSAPLLPGSYLYQWKIVDEWVRWIDNPSPKHTIAVDAKPGPACSALVSLRNKQQDASAALQACIAATPKGASLDLPAGRYYLSKQVKLDRTITLRTKGKRVTDARCPLDGAGCAQLVALPAFTDTYGLLMISASAAVDHLVLDGNRTARGGTTAHNNCAAGKNMYGYNAASRCSGCQVTNSVSKYALCGSGLEVGAGSNITVSRNTFSYCGVHTVKNLWADGLTVHDATSSTFRDNTFHDNTDLDLIFGGCVKCLIQNNVITHSADAAGGAFGALMIHKWPSTSGNYTGAEITGNKVDCGPNRRCGSGLYIASESWYPETPYGSTVAGQAGASIHGNQVVNAMNGLYIGARGFAIYQNGVLNAHGVSIPNSCHKTLVSATPYVVSPTAQDIDFHGENVDPVMKVHFSSASWKGCVPNYPF